MLRRLFSRSRPSPVPQELYGRLVTQARQAAFHETAGVPDTVPGRFDMICLHMFLLTRRLAAEADPLARPLAQETFDVFTGELDTALRELGVGDTSVAKRMKRMLGSYYALIEKLGPALDAGDHAAAGAGAGERFAPGNEAAPGYFAAYLASAEAALATTPFAAILSGKAGWPELPASGS